MKRYSDPRLLLLLMITCVTVSGCSSRHPLFPGYDELAERGFYAYVLPQTVSSQWGWSEAMRIWSWDRHCRGTEPTETANPVYVVYEGGPNPGLQIMIGPWNLAWNESRTTTTVKLDSVWAPSGVAEYYEIDGYVRLRFTDVFGFPVQIGSKLEISDLVYLANRLEYVGPPPENISDPWECKR
jgi:hypothetical protein